MLFFAILFWTIPGYFKLWPSIKLIFQRCTGAMEALIERPLGIWAHRFYSKWFRECVWAPKLSYLISVQITVSKQNDVLTQMETDAHIPMYSYADRVLTHTHTYNCIHLCLTWFFYTHWSSSFFMYKEHTRYVQTPMNTIPIDTHTNTLHTHAEHSLLQWP